MHDNAQSIFKQKSRSFSLAAKLFTAETRGDVARLYQFCRYVDDLADDSPQGQPQKLHKLTVALKEGAHGSGDPILEDFLIMVEERELPLHAALELVEASIADCGPCQIRTEDDLIRFAYGVAGTVGQMMCPLLGANDHRAEAFAIDLGIALQLTNIARDVAEDAARQRFYLPGEWVSPETIQLAMKGEHDGAIRRVDESVMETLELAERYYESALRGHWFIPYRNRRAIFFALNFYRAIGNKMRKRGSGSWQSRTRLGLTEKVSVGLWAWPRYRALGRGDWVQEEAPRHDDSLHKAFD